MSHQFRSAPSRWRATAVATSVAALCGLAAGPAVAATPALAAGGSVEGPGVYDDNVDISSTGDAQLIVEGEAPQAYGAANQLLTTDPVGTTNGGLNGLGTYEPGAMGFADVTDRLHDYTFTLKETVSEFSLRMLDFGDFNPTHATEHEVVMTAYDADGAVVDSDVLAFTSTTQTNPAELYDAGDAIMADPDGATDPGNHVFAVEGAGIATVTLKVTAGPDPNIGFTDLDYTLDGDCVFGTGEMAVALLAGQTMNAGEVSARYNAAGQLVVTFTATGGWSMTTTHLAVAYDPANLPQTKKGNPIPGQFAYSMAHDPAVTEYTYVLDGYSGPVYLAAHADLVKVSVGEFWASSVLASNPGDITSDPTGRDVPDAVLGAPDDTFYSLGIGGEIVVAFDHPVYNADGAEDLSIHEVTWGASTYPLESADVYGWDGDDWVLLGEATNEAAGGVTYLDLGPLMSTTKIKVVDTTDPADFVGRAYDGFDLDAVDAAALMLDAQTGWADGEGFPGSNWGTYFFYGDTACVWPEE